MPQISVIMPCLNMAEYIEQCLKSVADQTLSDIEILVIDAGSTDGTKEILHSWEKKDPRIQILYSDKRSYGYQVNLGIAAAHGRYIAIVDSDDKVLPDMFEVLYPIAAASGADYVKGAAEFFYEYSGTAVYRKKYLPLPAKAYGQDGKAELCPYKEPWLLLDDKYLWNGIYRSDFLKQVRLHESPGAAFQDLGGLLQIQMNAKHGVYISKPVYEYRQDNPNASVHNKKGFHFIADEYGWAKQFLKGCPSEWMKSFYKKLFFHTLDRMRAMASSGMYWREAENDMGKIAYELGRAQEQGILLERDFQPQQWEAFAAFLQKPGTLYEMVRNELREKKEPLQTLLKKLENEKIVIFGSGRLGSFVHLAFLYQGKGDVIAFCDNHKADLGASFMGIPVLSPQEAAGLTKAAYVIASRHYKEEMRQQLLTLGISDSRIHMYDGQMDLRLITGNAVGISVIVTVHNAQKHLEECLNSLLVQTFSNIEILCIDGGSVDSSPDILAVYAEKDNRIRIINDPNTSYGHKVNEGIRQAHGMYISVLESDDMYVPDMLERLYAVAEKYEPDFVNADYLEFCNIDGRQYQWRIRMYPPQDYGRLLESGKHPECMRQILRYWTGIFRRDFLLKKEIWMNESPGASFQDMSFRFLTSALADVCFHLDVPVYLYRADNPESSVHDPDKAVVIADEYAFLKAELKRRRIGNPYIWKSFYIWKYRDFYGNMVRFAKDARMALYKRCCEELKIDREYFSQYPDEKRPQVITDLLEKPEDQLLRQLEDGYRRYLERNRKQKQLYQKLTGRNIVIFGCGAYGKWALEYLYSFQNQIQCFADNKNEQGTHVWGYAVLPPREAVKAYPDAVYIVANKLYAKDMHQQLLELGILEDSIWEYKR